MGAWRKCLLVPTFSSVNTAHRWAARGATCRVLTDSATPPVPENALHVSPGNVGDWVQTGILAPVEAPWCPGWPPRNAPSAWARSALPASRLMASVEQAADRCEKGATRRSVERRGRRARRGSGGRRHAADATRALDLARRQPAPPATGPRRTANDGTAAGRRDELLRRVRDAAYVSSVVRRIGA